MAPKPFYVVPGTGVQLLEWTLTEDDVVGARAGPWLKSGFTWVDCETPETPLSVEVCLRPPLRPPPPGNAYRCLVRLNCSSPRLLRRCDLGVGLEALSVAPDFLLKPLEIRFVGASERDVHDVKVFVDFGHTHTSCVVLVPHGAVLAVDDDERARHEIRTDRNNSRLLLFGQDARSRERGPLLPTNPYSTALVPSGFVVVPDPSIYRFEPRAEPALLPPPRLDLARAWPARSLPSWALGSLDYVFAPKACLGMGRPRGATTAAPPYYLQFAWSFGVRATPPVLLKTRDEQDKCVTEHASAVWPEIAFTSLFEGLLRYLNQAHQRRTVGLARIRDVYLSSPAIFNGWQLSELQTACARALSTAQDAEACVKIIADETTCVEQAYLDQLLRSFASAPTEAKGEGDLDADSEGAADSEGDSEGEGASERSHQTCYLVFDCGGSTTDIALSSAHLIQYPDRRVDLKSLNRVANASIPVAGHHIAWALALRLLEKLGRMTGRRVYHLLQLDHSAATSLPRELRRRRRDLILPAECRTSIERLARGKKVEWQRIQLSFHSLLLSYVDRFLRDLTPDYTPVPFDLLPLLGGLEARSRLGLLLKLIFDGLPAWGERDEEPRWVLSQQGVFVGGASEGESKAPFDLDPLWTRLQPRPTKAGGGAWLEAQDLAALFEFETSSTRPSSELVDSELLLELQRELVGPLTSTLGALSDQAATLLQDRSQDEQELKVLFSGGMSIPAVQDCVTQRFEHAQSVEIQRLRGWDPGEVEAPVRKRLRVIHGMLRVQLQPVGDCPLRVGGTVSQWLPREGQLKTLICAAEVETARSRYRAALDEGLEATFESDGRSLRERLREVGLDDEELRGFTDLLPQILALGGGAWEEAHSRLLFPPPTRERFDQTNWRLVFAAGKVGLLPLFAAELPRNHCELTLLAGERGDGQHFEQRLGSLSWPDHEHAGLVVVGAMLAPHVVTFLDRVVGPAEDFDPCQGPLPTEIPEALAEAGVVGNSNSDTEQG